MYTPKFKYTYLCLMFIFLTCLVSQECLTNDLSGSGKYLTDKALKKVEIGMSKSSLCDLFGNPTFIFNKNIDCLCYYHLYIPKNKNKKILRHCVMFFFNNEALTLYKVLLY